MELKRAWGRAAQRANVTRLKAYAFALDAGTCLGKVIQRHTIPPKLDTNPVQYPVCLVFDPGQRRFIQQIVGTPIHIVERNFSGKAVAEWVTGVDIRADQ